jgi:hypothetical protein
MPKTTAPSSLAPQRTPGSSPSPLLLASAKGTGKAPKAETKSKPKGGANPAVQRAANRGSTLHSDKPGHLPDQLREKYPETEFKFNKPGQSGQDVSVQGGKHPSEYSDSTWKADANHGDFKPNTSTGKKTFEADQKKKWKEKTQMLPYDPKTGNLK